MVKGPDRQPPTWLGASFLPVWAGDLGQGDLGLGFLLGSMGVMIAPTSEYHRGD